MQRLRTGLLLLLLLPLLLPAAPARSAEEGWLVAARRTERQSDLWAAPASGGPWQRLTQSPDDERWPAWHPDGHTLAYAARRDRNWDLYALDLRTGEEQRLTTHPHFEGWPAWSPDGERLAYASAREGDLDLFVLDLGSGQETNLTPTSPAHDFEPRWEDEERLLFVSTRDQSQDLFRLTLADGEVAPLTQSSEPDERQPLPLPAGGLLALSRAGRASGWTRLNPAGNVVAPPVSWADTAHALALSPDGETVVWLERRLAGDVLYRRGVAGGPVEQVIGPTPRLSDLAWGQPDGRWMRARLRPPEAAPPPPAAAPQPSELVYLDNLDTAQPRLSGRVLPSFEALRARVLGELGQDFLGTVSETLRPIDFASAESDYLSWHKAGRALDTLLDLGWRGGRQLMEVVREDQHGDIYWRIWLRCPVQDGSCGEPLVEAPWDFSYEARWERAPGQGGLPKPFQSGYYVDFTRLAEDEGWERISAYENPDFDWRQNNIAAEFWHYQDTDGLFWYEAMQEVYTPAELSEWFDWAILRARAIPRWTLRGKGIPLPAEVRHAPAEVVVP